VSAEAEKHVQQAAEAFRAGDVEGGLAHLEQAGDLSDCPWCVRKAASIVAAANAGSATPAELAAASDELAELMPVADTFFERYSDKSTLKRISEEYPTPLTRAPRKRARGRPVKATNERKAALKHLDTLSHTAKEAGANYHAAPTSTARDEARPAHERAQQELFDARERFFQRFGPIRAAPRKRARGRPSKLKLIPTRKTVTDLSLGSSSPVKRKIWKCPWGDYESWEQDVYFHIQEKHAEDLEAGKFSSRHESEVPEGNPPTPNFASIGYGHVWRVRESYPNERAARKSAKELQSRGIYQDFHTLSRVIPYTEPDGTPRWAVETKWGEALLERGFTAEQYARVAEIWDASPIRERESYILHLGIGDPPSLATKGFGNLPPGVRQALVAKGPAAFHAKDYSLENIERTKNALVWIIQTDPTRAWSEEELRRRVPSVSDEVFQEAYQVMISGVNGAKMFYEPALGQVQAINPKRLEEYDVHEESGEKSLFPIVKSIRANRPSVRRFVKSLGDDEPA